MQVAPGERGEDDSDQDGEGEEGRQRALVDDPLVESHRQCRYAVERQEGPCADGRTDDGVAQRHSIRHDEKAHGQWAGGAPDQTEEADRPQQPREALAQHRAGDGAHDDEHEQHAREPPPTRMPVTWHPAERPQCDRRRPEPPPPAPSHVLQPSWPIGRRRLMGLHWSPPPGRQAGGPAKAARRRAGRSPHRVRPRRSHRAAAPGR